MTSLVLLSGWGIDARIWRPLASHWPADWQVLTPNWPGYRGSSPLDSPLDMTELARRMAGQLPGDSLWVGWSLGALLAARLLTHLPRPSALIILGMGKRFTTPNTDGRGVNDAEFAMFRRAFARDPAATWAHFLRWQLGGEPEPRRSHRQLRDLLGDAPPADVTTLRHGLEQLHELDIGDTLEHPPCPIHSLRGNDDPLIPPGSDHAPLPGCGHCPQLSQPDALAKRVISIAERQVTHS
ncbi:alpha/beta fold hydrolase [Aidingimonas lacisalsi]|uniref:alpha/beta fold hydrolase n=1 Tax=Aidingimonas lacisalsi TaxID=2604086 RepID=UPI0011D18824|nr:alpha/beta fold hydrolase [Aidingimonas lacisalsi]